MAIDAPLPLSAKVFLVVALGALAIGASAAPALGHAVYRNSDPSRGASLSAAPSRVSAEFTEPLTKDSSLQVIDPCGRRVDAGGSTVSGDRISVALAGDAAGAYRVHFRLISTVDGHPTRGGFTFSVDEGEECPEETAAAGAEADERGLFEGIPVIGAIAAYLIAAAIGATGGFVYSNIVRPE